MSFREECVDCEEGEVGEEEIASGEKKNRDVLHRQITKKTLKLTRAMKLADEGCAILA
jgi:hypothetical protein